MYRKEMKVDVDCLGSFPLNVMIMNRLLLTTVTVNKESGNIIQLTLIGHIRETAHSRDCLHLLYLHDDEPVTATRADYRSSGLICLTIAVSSAASPTLRVKCTRFSEGGCFAVLKPGRHSFDGRIGRGAKLPPQFGQTLASLVSAQEAQKVHS